MLKVQAELKRHLDKRTNQEAQVKSAVFSSELGPPVLQVVTDIFVAWGRPQEKAP